ncbi:hypothetical protein CC78DRAFT_513507 [Lojkania enalia]|uniref:Opioid growth factor receptor (OGFr) conserved domain-containing protein n=1 Tax=Lojkania enalia TaxID=147567 RepID=A0A9P4KHS5_9PLEO|nr:hypothetical protein CC78DRAFT_513507 [Didymosphaeria enalia]
MSSGKRLKFLSTKPGDAVDFDDAQPNIIIHFYDPELKAPDAHGRTLDDILEWADSALENSHNYIQMLFPLPEGSPFNYEAPIINREVMEAFHGRPELRARLKESFVRILDFYGFELLEESTHEAVTTSTLPRVPSILVVRAPHWPKAFRNWAIRFDHNHLRITRILRCLRVLGLEMECEAYYSALKEVFNDPRIHINERSMLYWRKAVRGPLHIAPDGERIGWLRRWGEEQQSLASASHTETTK